MYAGILCANSDDYHQQAEEEMQLKIRTTIFSGIAILGVSLISTPLQADQNIRCESKHHQYNMCRVDTHGYVRLVKEHSRTACIKGRTWDYDRRGIWVDDNCKADFVIESRHHTDGHKDHSGAGAVAAVAAVALIAAAASAASDNKHEDRYHDDSYHHGGHSSYIPNWMIGEFEGYNLKFGSEVNLDINEDGRVRAVVDGTRLHGYVNDDRLYIGDAEFYIERAGNGFNTVQMGDRSNKVHYTRQ
jgi:hypothetical protein